MCKVTVSIPTYNRCFYLKEAMDSVLNQTFCDFRLLITDNGSTDGTRELVERYSRQDKRIVYNRFSSNLGPAANWKYALTTPKTKYVALLPDDDIWMPEYLRHAIKSMEETPDAALYGCITEAFGDYPNLAARPYYLPVWMTDCDTLTVYDSVQDYSPLLLGSPFAPSCITFRRDLVDRIVVPWTDDFPVGDYMFYAQLALHGSLVYDPVVRVKYRWHKDNDSNRVMGTRRCAAQMRYVIRYLATQALAKGALAPENIAKFVRQLPLGPVSNMAVALATIDSPQQLRGAAFSVFFERRASANTDQHVSRHYILACKIGGWYLNFADLVDRVMGLWWRPKL